MIAYITGTSDKHYILLYESPFKELLFCLLCINLCLIKTVFKLFRKFRSFDSLLFTHSWDRIALSTYFLTRYLKLKKIRCSFHAVLQKNHIPSVTKRNIQYLCLTRFSVSRWELYKYIFAFILLKRHPCSAGRVTLRLNSQKPRPAIGIDVIETRYNAFQKSDDHNDRRGIIFVDEITI